MGVTGDLLNRMIKTAGHDLDLGEFKDHGIAEQRRVVAASTSADGSSSPKRRRLHEPPQLRPLRVGVDVGVWIARASHGFGSMLVDERHLSNMGRAMLLQKDEPTEQEAALQAESRRAYVERCTNYVLERIQKVQTSTGAQLLVVLDGATPPIKESECQDRSQKKREAAARRDDLPDVAESPGTQTKKRMKAARRAGAGRSHSAIVSELIVALRKNRVSFLVAPYEADAQLAFFAQRGMIDLVLTEDSDLIAHGCHSILYKSLDDNGGGRGILLQRDYFGCMEMKPKSLSLLDFSDVMLAVLFVAVGCDYCSSLKQIGSVAARDTVREAFLAPDRPEEEKRPALAKVFERLYQQTSQKDMTDPERTSYEANFLAALFMYRHPIVFDPFQCKCVMLREPGVDTELMDYEPYAELCSDEVRRDTIVGTFHGTALETHIAEGWINARTKKPYPDMEVPPHVLNDLPKDGGEEVETESQGDGTQGPPAVHFGTQAATDNSQPDIIVLDDDDEDEFQTQAGATTLI